MPPKRKDKVPLRQGHSQFNYLLPLPNSRVAENVKAAILRRVQKAAGTLKPYIEELEPESEPVDNLKVDDTAATVPSSSPLAPPIVESKNPKKDVTRSIQPAAAATTSLKQTPPPTPLKNKSSPTPSNTISSSSSPSRSPSKSPSKSLSPSSTKSPPKSLSPSSKKSPSKSPPGKTGTAHAHAPTSTTSINKHSLKALKESKGKDKDKDTKIPGKSKRTYSESTVTDLKAEVDELVKRKREYFWLLKQVITVEAQRKRLGVGGGGGAGGGGGGGGGGKG